eukprot:gene11167-23335_t
MESTRDNFISQGISFLKNTESSAMSKRINFLETKGLSNKEIVEALKRADPKSLNSTIVPHSSEFSIWNIVSSSAVMLGVGYFVYTLSSFLESPIEKHDEVISNLMESNVYSNNIEKENKLDEILKQLTNFSNLIEKQTDIMEKTIKDTVESTEPKWVEELKKISSTMLQNTETLNMKIQNTNETSTSLSELKKSNSSTSISDKPCTIEDHMSAVRTEILNLQRSASTSISTAAAANGNGNIGHNISNDMLKKGCEMLRMYLSNILEYPDIPRYRKIITSNQSFKTLVSPLSGHVAFLCSVGFIHRKTSSGVGASSYFEWKGIRTGTTGTGSGSITGTTTGSTAADGNVIGNMMEDFSSLNADNQMVLREGIRLLNVLIDSNGNGNGGVDVLLSPPLSLSRSLPLFTPSSDITSTSTTTTTTTTPVPLHTPSLSPSTSSMSVPVTVPATSVLPQPMSVSEQGTVTAVTTAPSPKELDSE